MTGLLLARGLERLVERIVQRIDVGEVELGLLPLKDLLRLCGRHAEAFDERRHDLVISVAAFERALDLLAHTPSIAKLSRC